MSILEIASNEIGTEEIHDNKTKYGKWYGMDGNPWCAMFVSWVYAQAGLSKSIAASTAKGFASCDAGLKWFAKKGKLVQEGDIVFFQFDTDAQPDHVGIVISNNKILKNFTCIEGNTSPNNKGSQSNGGGVYKKKRAYATVMAVARP
jgi:cell wall-associated NlpC family hydrolase